MIRIDAEILFYSSEEGGQHAVCSGISLSLDVDGSLIACSVYVGEEGTVVKQGVRLEGTLRIWYGEFYEDSLRFGEVYRLMVGSRQIGEARLIGRG